MSILQTFNRLMGARMAASGRFAMVETVGRKSGRTRSTPVGFEWDEHGNLLVGAGSPTAHWAHNLLANPSCRASVGGRTSAYRAEHLVDDARDAALRAIKGRYGPGMADRIGLGPVFRLVPATAATAAQATPAAPAAPAAAQATPAATAAGEDRS